MNKKIFRVLLIDDDKDIFTWIQDLLSDAAIFCKVQNLLSDTDSVKFELEWVPTFDEAISAINKSQHDIYLIDYHLGEKNGIDLLNKAIEIGCKAPIILLTGKGDLAIDIFAMKSGAADYLNKYQLSAELLERSIRYAIERNSLELERDKLISELKKALALTKKLSGLLPICSSCKKIRDDKGYWNQVETYIEKHSDANFTHGICSECSKKLYPEIYNQGKK